MFSNEHIHHYTTIDTLALILRNRTIRFNRLDRVDDVSESQTASRIQFGKYYFVSCWTHSHEESIPQWHMYTDLMSGVRISLPRKMFKMRPLVPNPEWNSVSKGTILSPVPFSKIFSTTYFIPPIFLSEEQFMGDVHYTDNVEAEYKASVDFQIAENEKANLKISNLGRLARLKKTAWAFQNEFRFVLFILPSIPIPPGGIGDPAFYEQLPNHILNCFHNGIGPELSYFDVEIEPAILDDVIITLGPLCSEGSLVTVESLAKRFAKNGVVIPSKFTGTIRRASR